MNKTDFRWLLLLPALAALVFLAPGAANAAKPASLLLVFDDLAGDAIQSDGLGGYAAHATRDGGWTVSTGQRSIYFDFSTQVSGNPNGTFGYDVTAGYIDGVTITVTPIDETSASATFDFRLSDPYTADHTDFSLVVEVSVTTSGSTAQLTASSDADLYYLWQSSGIRGKGRFEPPSWEWAGAYDMPWGAQVGP